MPFPESHRAVFRKNPLAEVICQFRFPTILAIAAEPPSTFQEKVRESYPLYETPGDASAWPKELGPILSQLSIKFPGEATTHKFLAEGEKRSISLAQDFVAVSDQQYGRWEDFRREIVSVEAAARDVYKPAFYSRVGLRYRNIINKDALGLGADGWDTLVQPYFAGLLSSDDVRDHIQQITTVVQINLSEIAGALVQIRHGLARVSPDQEAHYVIDADFYTEGRYTSQHAFTALDLFHRRAGDLFRWAITGNLYRALDPISVE